MSEPHDETEPGTGADATSDPNAGDHSAGAGGPDLSSLRRLSQNAKPLRPSRDINIGRAAAFLAAAVIVVLLPWVVFTRIGDPGPAKPPRPGAGHSTRSPTPGPAVSVLPDAGVYEVVGDVQCARIRVLAGTDQEILNCVKPGTMLRSDGQIKTADNFAWLHVEDPFKKLDGWIATKYVRRAEPSPSPS